MAEAKKATKKVANSKKQVVSKEKKVTAKKAVAKTLAVDKKTASKPNGVSKVAEDVIVPVEAAAEPVVAKAGRRSAKALKETEEKQAKASRKAAQSSEAESEGGKNELPKKIQKPARSRLDRRGKKFQEVAKLIDRNKDYAVKEGLGILVKTSTTKFDASVELHINLGVDPKQADQNIRGTVVLPAGTGKSLRVAVMAEADDAAKAKKAGADIAGLEEITSLLDKETINFDVLIATPSQMAKLGKYARLLGPRGLMPNPKSGTVTTDVTKAVSEAKAGKVEYRVDSTGIVHLGVGKVSFGEVKLEQNVSAVIASIKSVKPNSIKGAYLKSAYLTTTMGPSLRLTLSGEA